MNTINGTTISSKQIIIFYLLSFGVAWLFWWPMALTHLGVINLPIPLIIGQTIGAFAPLFSVFIISRLMRNKHYFSSFFESIKKTKKQLVLSVFAAFFAIIIALIISIIDWGINPNAAFNLLKSTIIDKYGIAVIGVIFFQFIIMLIGSPLGEEIGWRGFALTNLNKKKGRLIASLIVGTMWWTWHIPLFIVIGAPLTVNSLLEFIGFSFIIDTLFLYSGNNLFIAMLCHQSINTKFTFFAGKTNTPLGLIVLCMVGILVFFIFNYFFKKKQDLSLRTNEVK